MNTCVHRPRATIILWYTLKKILSLKKSHKTPSNLDCLILLKKRINLNQGSYHLQLTLENKELLRILPSGKSKRISLLLFIMDPSLCMIWATIQQGYFKLIRLDQLFFSKILYLSSSNLNSKVEIRLSNTASSDFKAKRFSSALNKGQRNLNSLRSKLTPGTQNILLNIVLKENHQQSEVKDQAGYLWRNSWWCSSSTWIKISMTICSSTLLMSLIVCEMIYRYILY